MQDEYNDSNQQNHDVLFVLTGIFVPVECLVQKGNEPQEQSHQAGPHAEICAPNPRAHDTDNNQYQS